MEDRSSKIKIGDKEYELLLTTKATKEIAKKYGGISKLGDNLINDDYEKALDDVLWLVVLLANQPILIHNLKNPNNKMDLLTQEELEVLTTPYDIADFKDAISEAIIKGSQRYIKSEDTGKNVVSE